MADATLSGFFQYTGQQAPDIDLTRVMEPFRPPTQGVPEIDIMASAGVDDVRRRLRRIAPRREALRAIIGTSSSFLANEIADRLCLIEGRPGTLVMQKTENANSYTVILTRIRAVPSTSKLLIPGTSYDRSVVLSCICEFRVSL